MNKKPFFSIVIPTYNRCNSLKSVLNNISEQTFINYEVIVIDNASVDDTKKICTQIKDKRIKYYRNKQNIGFANNLYKGIKLAKGKYIFLHGDDDELVSKKVFDNIKKILNRKTLGYIRLKYYYRIKDKNIIDYFSYDKSIKYISPSSSYRKIIDFILKSYFGFLTGVIFRNDGIKRLKYMENNGVNLQMDGFFIDYLIPISKKYGAAIDYDNYVIATWSANKKNVHYYDFNNNECSYEKTWNIITKYLNKEEKKKWLEEETYKMIFNLLSLKYYSSNKNLILHAKRLIELNNKLIWSPVFWAFFIGALLMPNKIWELLRSIVYSFKKINLTLNID